MNQNKRAVIYCRVSTKEQVEEGNSLSTQEKICREYALKNGYDIVKVFIEAGESAKTTMRPQLQDMLSFCSSRKNSINAVIAYKIDRISRNTDDYSQIRMLLKRYKVEIKSTSEYFENTPAGRFMENIIANVSQFDNDVRTERAVNGMRDAVREGRYVWRAPVGYRNIKINGKSTITSSDVAPLVKLTFEEVARNVYPANVIRVRMNKLGLRTPYGQEISDTHFYSILRNELYTGVIKKFGECHQGMFEPIISKELYNQVQWVLDGKKKSHTHPRLENPDFPLRRFVTYQQIKLTGAWSKGRKKRYPYYWFPQYKLRVRKERLEAKFLGFMDTFSFNGVELNRFKKLLNDNYVNRVKDRFTQNERVKAAIADLEREETLRLQNADEGIITKQVLQRQLERIAEERANLTQQLIISKSVPNFDVVLRGVSEFLKSPSKVWKQANFEQKLALQWFEFPEGITYDGEKLRTAEICRIYKTKSHFLPSDTAIVPQRNFISNTPEVPNSADVEYEPDNTSVFWDNIGDEVIKLAEILNKN